MKKLFLAVAVLATSVFAANAQVIYNGADWAVDQTGLEEVTGPTASLAKTNATLTVNGADAQFANITGGVEATVTFTSQFTGSYTNSNSEKKFVKIAKNGNIQYEGKDFIFRLSGLTIGDKVVFTDNGGAANAGFFQDGSTTAITLEAQNGTVEFIATGSTMEVKTDGTKARISKIEVISAASDNNAISKDLLYKAAGEELVNTTGLEVSIYTVSGVKVLTSSEAAINISGLQSGAYVASTEKGFLKFVK